MLERQMEMTGRTDMNSLNNNNHMKEEEKLIEISATNRQRVIRNNLYLVSLLNVVTILLFIFSMSFYQWIRLDFQTSKGNITVWVNLLYVYNGKYMSFGDYAKLECVEGDDLCTSILEQLSFVGIFSFLINFFAHTIQLVDFFVFLYRVCKKRPLVSSNFFRQVFVIGTFMYGLTIYLFSAAVIKNVKGTVYGVCIYLSMVSVCLLIGVVVYEQISIRRMIEAELVMELLEGQKQYNERESEKYSVGRQSDSFVL